MSVLVVTDSAATLPDDLVAELGIVVVPLHVVIDGAEYRDGEIPITDMLDHGPEGVSTSGPSPGDFLLAIEDRAGPDGVVILTVSHDMGESTFLAARAAASSTELSVRVVDTETAAGGQGLVVLAAARRAAAGGSIEEVEAVARSVVPGVRLVASLPNLDHLARSGHVPGAGAWAARFVGLRPVIDFRRGSVKPMRPALSDEAAVERVLAAWRDTRPEDPDAGLHVAALHALVPHRADEILAAVRREVEPRTAFVGSFSTGMIVHSGPGLAGLAWWWEPSTRHQ